MNRNLLIIGAGVYGLVAKEVAESMGCFEKIDFLDDGATETPNGIPVLGKLVDLKNLSASYQNVIVAIGNPEVRMKMIHNVDKMTQYHLTTLVSPRAYVASSAQLGKGCVVEPMAVIHTGCIIGTGCLISAGAVINHLSICCDGVHVDCNATVAGNTIVPANTKVASGSLFTGVK